MAPAKIQNSIEIFRKAARKFAYGNKSLLGLFKNNSAFFQKEINFLLQ